MGQTLSHGVYLPNEGERNCYAGLASNWQILNTAVGAIAEKAPLVHTHTVSQITDFPAYGTTAGTICEGNDSRLSDARTPLAHTHTKSDVTDLLNSNFIPSANNSYDLGSSTNQWKSVYAQNYYYKGVAWGLDKANEWTEINTFSAASYGEKLKLKNTSLDLSNGNPAVSSICQHMIWWDDKNNTHYAKIHAWANNTNSTILLTSYYREDANTVRTSSLRNQCGASSKAFFPESNSDTDLGISTNKWKSFNGVNPGALSLPDMDSTVSKSTELATAIDKTQTANSWTADFTGILRITWFVKNLTGPFRCTVSNNSDIRYATWGQTFSVNDAWYFIVSFPVQNGKTYYFDNSFTRTSEDTAPIIYGASAVYCLGNV